MIKYLPFTFFLISCLPARTLPERDFRRQVSEEAPVSPDLEGPTASSVGLNGCLQGSGSFMEKGPYQVSRESKGDFTLFFPADIASSPYKHPVVWGNGTTQRGVAIYASIGEHLASWGIITAHSHADGGGGLSGAAPMKAALDATLAMNTSSGQFQGKLLEDTAGASGHSQGGIGAQAMASKDARVKAVVDMMGGGVAVLNGGASHNKSTLLLTGTGDFMNSSIGMAFSSLKGEALKANFSGYEHMLGPTKTVNFRAASAAWFRCKLTEDSNACSQLSEGSPIFPCSA